MVSMGGPAIGDQIRDLGWGTATAESLGTPAYGGGVAPMSQYARRWCGDVREVVGVVPDARRVVLGWPHLQPDGPGRWDTAALDRCDRALDAMLDGGLRPSLALLHVDLPGWLERAGGWLARDTALRFADYAAEVARRFGDRVDRWITCTDFVAPSLADHVAGMRPPGRGIGSAGMPAVHHVLLGHGLAVEALRAAGISGTVGGAMPLVGSYAATDDPWDRIALERCETWTIRLLLDPLLLGEHLAPEDGPSPVEASGCVRPGDMEIIRTPQDFLGLSWSVAFRVAAPENLVRVLPARGYFGALNDVNRLLTRLGFVIAPLDGVATTSHGWPIVPEAPADAVAAVRDIYGDLLPPLYLTDRGSGHLDGAGSAEQIDARRRALLAARLGWLSVVMAEGVDVRGYEYWSYMDDLEWVLQYVRLYGMAVPEREPELSPPPCDWVKSGPFRVTDPMGPVSAGAGGPGIVRAFPRGVRAVASRDSLQRR